MKKNFDEKRSAYLFDMVNNATVISKYCDVLLIPNIENQDLRRILLYPRNESELVLARHTLALCINLNNNLDNIKKDGLFDPFETDAYTYLEIATEYTTDFIKRLSDDYDNNNISSLQDVSHDFENITNTVASSIHHENLDKYNEVCCDLNILYLQYFEEIFNELSTKVFPATIDGKTVISLFSKNSFVISAIGGTLKKVFYDDNKDISIDEVLNNANIFVKQFDEYVNKLSVNVRTK